MPHIHTEPGHHDHTVSAFIVKTDGHEPKILLHVHKLLKKYLQFGGHIELHEDPWDAVKHEIKEESGYDIGQLKILQPRERFKTKSGDVKQHPLPIYQLTHGGFPDDHKHIDIGYCFVTNQEPKHPVDKQESTDIRGFSKTELGKISDNLIDKDIREICLYIFDHCLESFEKISPKEFDC